MSGLVIDRWGSEWLWGVCAVVGTVAAAGYWRLMRGLPDDTAEVVPDATAGAAPDGGAEAPAPAPANARAEVKVEAKAEAEATGV